MWIFFYLRDLPEELFENLKIEQSVRYGNLIEYIQKGAKIVME
jgi:hypothetical protein